MYTRGRFVPAALAALAVALGVVVTPTYAATNLKVVQFQIRDDCDPATFNAAVGPGTCIGKGDVTFARFISVLQRLGREPEWRFVPDRANMKVGQSFKATNVGGEVHSFTEVAQFGGGVVPILNQLSKSGPMAPECGSATLVPPGQSFSDTETANDVGHPVLYQCCIHPWMHAVITVRAQGKEDD